MKNADGTWFEGRVWKVAKNGNTASRTDAACAAHSLTHCRESRYSRQAVPAAHTAPASSRQTGLSQRESQNASHRTKGTW